MSTEIAPYNPPQTTLERYEAALKTIVAREGRVCEFFLKDGCAHQACRSSYYAWVVAQEALYPFMISSESALP